MWEYIHEESLQRRKGLGGESCYNIGSWAQLIFQRHLVLGMGFWKRVKTHQKIFFEANDKTTNLVVAKNYDKTYRMDRGIRNT